MKKKNILLPVFCMFFLNLLAQNGFNRQEIGLNGGINVAWFRGENRINFPFSASALPKLGVFYGYNLTKSHQISVGVSKESIESVYQVKTFDVKGNPVQADFLLSARYYTLSLHYQYLLERRTNTRTGIGIFYSWVAASDFTVDYNLKVGVPIFVPYYAFLSSKQNFGVVFNVRQPIFKIGFFHFELEANAQLGLNNVNNNPQFLEPDALRTRGMGLSLNCVIKPPIIRPNPASYR